MPINVLIDSESSSIISNGSSVADPEDIDSTNEAFGQEPRPDVTNPPIDLENERKRMVDILEAQSAKLGVAFREIKATTNYFLNATQGQQGAEIRNPETGRRVKLENGDFVRLNGWIESSMDILKQYLLLDNVNIGVNGPEEGAETRDQNGSDLNKGLFLIGIEGYTVLMEEVELLKSAANGKTAPLSNEVHLTEELHRFLNWGSYTSIEEGQLAILASHPLYRDIQDVLERVIVTLITICEECFLKESTFVTSSPAAGDRTRLSPWLEQAKGFLEGLSEKSFKTEMYFISSATPLNGNESALTESLDGGEPVEGSLTSGVTQNTHEHNGSDHALKENTSQEESPDQADTSSFQPATSSPITSSSSQGPPVDYLLEQLKDCNDMLSPLSKFLEMAKASMGTGTHSSLYQAVRNSQHEAPLPQNQSYTGVSNQQDPKVPAQHNISTSTPPRPNPIISQQRSVNEDEDTVAELGRQLSKIQKQLEDVRNATAQPTLYDKIQAAALADTEALPSLLADFRDIGFGLYCERSRAVLDVLGLDKWVELEILTCMWRNASQRTRDSFRQLSKKTLPGEEGFILKPPASNSHPRGQQSSYGGGHNYNTAQPPPASFESGHNQKQQTPPRDFTTPFPPSAGHEQLNPIRVTGRYTTTYYPQTSEILPNETHGTMAQGQSFRRPVRSDSRRDESPQLWPNRPLIAAEAYNSAPSLYNSGGYYSSQNSYRPADQTFPDMGYPQSSYQSRSRDRSHVPSRPPPPPVQPSSFAVSDIMDPLDPKKRESSPDTMSYYRSPPNRPTRPVYVEVAGSTNRTRDGKPPPQSDQKGEDSTSRQNQDSWRPGLSRAFSRDYYPHPYGDGSTFVQAPPVPPPAPSAQSKGWTEWNGKDTSTQQTDNTPGPQAKN